MTGALPNSFHYRVTLLLKLEPSGGFQLQLLVPFTVTKPVTSQEMAIAVESRDVKLVFGKIS